MESGLEDRNNPILLPDLVPGLCVSMESGLEDRNNLRRRRLGGVAVHVVSMESGLEDRNN